MQEIYGRDSHQELISSSWENKHTFNLLTRIILANHSEMADK